MPVTAPFSASRNAKMAANAQGMVYKIQCGRVIEFRAYCCNVDADEIMGVAKEPVPILFVTPNPVCLFEKITWDLSQSYAPGSTLTGWEVDFGDAYSTGGSDFPNDTTNGEHAYTTTGTKLIEATVEEPSGETSPQTVKVYLEVIDCEEPIVPEDIEHVSYMGSEGQGVWYIDWVDYNAGGDAWLPLNEGLSGDSLYVRSLAVKPSTKNNDRINQEVWIATKGGVYQSIDGGNTWAFIVLPDPTNTAGDSPAPTVADLDYYKVMFDPLDESVILVVGNTTYEVQ